MFIYNWYFSTPQQQLTRGGVLHSNPYVPKNRTNFSDENSCDNNHLFQHVCGRLLGGLLLTFSLFLRGQIEKLQKLFVAFHHWQRDEKLLELIVLFCCTGVLIRYSHQSSAADMLKTALPTLSLNQHHISIYNAHTVNVLAGGCRAKVEQLNTQSPEMESSKNKELHSRCAAVSGGTVGGPAQSQE